METNRRSRRLLDFAGGEKMVEVGMSVKDMRDRQSKLTHLVENSLVGSTRIDHDRLLCHWIADDRTIAPKRRDGKGFSNHGRHDPRMLQAKPIRAQAAALLLVSTEVEWPKRLRYQTRSSFVLDGGTTRGILLRSRQGVGLRRTAGHDHCGDLAPREKTPYDPTPTALEPVSRQPPWPDGPGRPPALRACPPWQTGS